jgi:hypothetical protein
MYIYTNPKNKVLKNILCNIKTFFIDMYYSCFDYQEYLFYHNINSDDINIGENEEHGFIERI